MTPPTPSEVLADDVKHTILRIEQLRAMGKDNGTVTLTDKEYNDLLAALRAGPPELKAAYLEGYEDALKDKGQPKGMVLVPQTLIRRIAIWLEIASEYGIVALDDVQRPTPNAEAIFEVLRDVDRLFAAASSGGKMP